MSYCVNREKREGRTAAMPKTILPSLPRAVTKSTISFIYNKLFETPAATKQLARPKDAGAV